MRPLGQIHHLALKAADVERVALFYREVLGLNERDRHFDATGLRSIWLGAGAAILMIERADALPSPTAFGASAPGLHLVAFTIPSEDREAWRQKLAHAGHPIVHETGYTIYVLDPEGNRIGLSCYPDPSPRPGDE